MPQSGRAGRRAYCSVEGSALERTERTAQPCETAFCVRHFIWGNGQLLARGIFPVTGKATLAVVIERGAGRWIGFRSRNVFVCTKYGRTEAMTARAHFAAMEQQY